MDEPVGVPGKNFLLQLGGPFLQLLDVGQTVLNQSGEQVHQKIPRAALVVGMHGQYLRQQRRAGFLRGQHKNVRALPHESETFGGLLGPGGNVQRAQNAPGVKIHPAVAQLVRLGQMGGGLQLLGQGCGSGRLRREHRQHPVPGRGRFGQGLQRGGQLIIGHNTAPPLPPIIAHPARRGKARALTAARPVIMMEIMIWTAARYAAKARRQ